MRVKVGAIVLAASVVALSAVTFSMRSNLADVERTLDATEEAKAGVEAELATTHGELAATEDAKAGVEAELATTEEELAATEDAKAGVEAELATTEEELAATEDAKAGVEAELATTEEELAATKEDVTAAEKAKAAAESRAASAAAELRTLQETIGSLESIQAEIRRLEEARRPLIPDISTDDLVCTGSMEPVITCLDTVDMLRNIDRDDIVIGAVVDVTLADGRRVLHRVVDIRGEKILPKGDNSDQDDGWVPLGNVNEYLVGITRNVYMDNAWLRERVNGAAAKEQTAWEEYERLAGRYCGGPDKVDPCHTSRSNFRKVLNAWEEHTTAWCRYTLLLEQASPDEWEPRKPVCAGRYESAATSSSIHYGPVSDSLLHEDDGTVETHRAGVALADFEAVALLGNPYRQATGDWDYGFIFRMSDRNNFHAVVLTADGRWSHRLRAGSVGDTSTLASGRISWWDDADDYFFTQLRLVVKGDTGWFHVSGDRIAKLDLSGGPASGDVGVVTGYSSGNEVEGQYTPFNEFVVYDISDPPPLTPNVSAFTAMRSPSTTIPDRVQHTLGERPTMAVGLAERVERLTNLLNNLNQDRPAPRRPAHYAPSRVSAW